MHRLSALSCHLSTPSEGTSSSRIASTELGYISLDITPMYPTLLGCPFVPIAWHICVEFISYNLPIMFSFLVVALYWINGMFQPGAH
jgi:hypothetical protein